MSNVDLDRLRSEAERATPLRGALSEDDLARLDALDAAATPGPWKAVSSELYEDEYSTCTFAAQGPTCGKNGDTEHADDSAEQAERDAALIAEYRTAVPRLVDALRATRVNAAEFRAYAEDVLQAERVAHAETKAEAERLRVALAHLVGVMESRDTSDPDEQELDVRDAIDVARAALAGKDKP